MLSEQEIFRIWDYGHDSGAGSDPDFAKEYIQFVSRFIKEHDIRTVVDLGCGDFRIGSSIDYGDVPVTAVDASEKHIKNHRERFVGDPRFTFIHGDVARFDDSGFDLALVKDVVQHWPSEAITEWLARPHARYVLLTNDGRNETNSDIPYIPAEDGKLKVACRNLDMTRPPFSLEGREVLKFNGKVVFLWERK